MARKASKLKNRFWHEAFEEYPIIPNEGFDYSFDRYNYWRHIYYPWRASHTVLWGAVRTREYIFREMAEMLCYNPKEIPLWVEGLRCAFYNVWASTLKYYVVNRNVKQLRAIPEVKAVQAAVNEAVCKSLFRQLGID